MKRKRKLIGCRDCGTLKYLPQDTLYWVCGLCNAKAVVAALPKINKAIGQSIQQSVAKLEVKP